jgi:hypothetical protein
MYMLTNSYLNQPAYSGISSYPGGNVSLMDFVGNGALTPQQFQESIRPIVVRIKDDRRHFTVV